MKAFGDIIQVSLNPNPNFQIKPIEKVFSFSFCWSLLSRFLFNYCHSLGKLCSYFGRFKIYFGRKRI